MGPRPGTVGTLAWLDATEGVLRPRDRLRLLGQGLRFEAAETPRLLAGRLGRGAGRRRQATTPAATAATATAVDLDAIRIPDSAAARAAAELVAQARPASLVSHSHRTYLWASVLGAARGLRWDEEALYVASLVHDLGLAEGADHGRGCFTRVGVDAARKVGAAGGWSAARADLAAEAVSLHMNLRVPASAVEAHLVTAGTVLDVVGAGYWSVPEETARAILARHPRGPLKHDLVAAFEREARTARGTRAAFYTRALGLNARIRLAPFGS